MAVAKAGALIEEAQHILDVSEDQEKALALADEALKLGEEAGSDKVIADATRCRINCHRLVAQDARRQDEVETKRVMAAAEKMANQALLEFREKKSRYGEALMLMLSSDIILESNRIPESRRGNKKRQEVVDRANTALRIFQELGEKKLEAEAMVVLATGILTQNDEEKAIVWLEQAVKLSRALGDRKGEAQALYRSCLALNNMPSSKDTLDKSIALTKQVIEIYRDLGLQRMLAWQSDFLGKQYLLVDKPRDALACAKEAMRIFAELGYGKGWQTEARSTYCRALVGLADVKGALRCAREGVRISQAAGDKRSEILSLENLINVTMEGDAFYECGDISEALESALKCVELCKDVGDKKWEANMLHNVAQAYLRQRDLEPALKAITESSALLDDLGQQLLRSMVLQTAIEILMAKGDATAALEVTKEIQRISKDLGKPSRQANAMLMEAQVYFATGNCEQALRVTQEAQALFQQYKDKKGEGLCWSVIADVRKSMGEQGDALRASRTTQALYQQVGDKRSQAYAMKTSTSLFVANKSDQEAVKSAHEALALARATGEPKAEVEMLNLVAQATLNSIIRQSQVLDDQEAVDFIAENEGRAVRPAREAAALARKLGDKQMTGIATYSLAQCHAVAGRTAAAVQAATESRSLFMQTWDRQGEAMSVLMLAESIVLNGDNDGGRNLAKESFQLFKDLEDKDGMEKAQKTLDQIDQIAGGLAGTGSPMPTSPATPATAQAESAAIVKRKVGLSPDKAKDLAMKVAFEAIGTGEDVTLDDALMDIGLDSLAAIAFREQLQHNAGVPLPSTLIFDYPTLSAVVDHLVEASQELM
eukprot:gb/GFBE01040744.1/.p1 GENE.gb/GFBE01040744.1/~~gb/GFBE01040744.1/.p1  ORF type:complete len:827 (+),score=230.53 gb/GFBE01040744.1/:1-2481(+)